MIAKLERITADVLEQPVAELAEAVKTAEAANIDETGWREAGLKAWLWVVVTSVGVVFRIARSRAGAVAEDLLGEEPKPIVISDRFPGYEWIKLEVEAGLLGAHHPNAIDNSVGLPASPRVRAPSHHPAPTAPPGRGLTAPRPRGPAG